MRMMISWFALAHAAMAPPPLTPSASPRLTLPLSPTRSLLLSAPSDDEIMQSWIMQAHAAAAAAPPEQYDDIMEEYTTSQPQQYWAQVWPSAVALAQRLLEEDEKILRAKAVLELGCGLGVASIAAALQGARVVDATDIEENALKYCAANAKLNEIEEDVFRTAAFDWHEVAPPGGQSTYDVVLAADCVYDEEAPALLSQVLHSTVAVGGRVLLTDNADRPYESRRREALLEALCGCDEGDDSLALASFELDRQFTTTVELESRQGSRFEITHCDLTRVR